MTKAFLLQMVLTFQGLFFGIQTSLAQNPTFDLHDSILVSWLQTTVVTPTRLQETRWQSAISLEQWRHQQFRYFSSVYELVELTKGLHTVTPSGGFKVLNARGFANTTNVRFMQLTDGADIQSPHIGAPIGNALSPIDIDVDRVEIQSGTASVLYGLNAVNGLVNYISKNPFVHQGLSIQLQPAFNNVEIKEHQSATPYYQGQLRFAKVIKPNLAVKIAGAFYQGIDGYAENQQDLQADANISIGLFGVDNPARDEVNSYGNESPNTRTLLLYGKNYRVSRTGYKERELDDYHLGHIKGSAEIHFKPGKNQEILINFRGALINSIYQRANRFRLKDYLIQQLSFNYKSKFLQGKFYINYENTGQSYNLRSLAENLDRSFKPDELWFNDYSTYFQKLIDQGTSITNAHQISRLHADHGRYKPGTTSFIQEKERLTRINNWDIGAALRVKSFLTHAEVLIPWHDLYRTLFNQNQIQCITGIDHRSIIIIPDGNYFINPTNSFQNLVYSKTGIFTQVQKRFTLLRSTLSMAARLDKSDFFKPTWNPRITYMYHPKIHVSFRAAFQTGYRFPSIFEGFSNVNSGGVKRMGGLPIMSFGIFERSFTKNSIDLFQKKVNEEMNINGLSKDKAIEKHQDILQRNPYSYLKPEQIKTWEAGLRWLVLKKSLFIDLDIYFSRYKNFIAQMEASVPLTLNPDSIPTYLYHSSQQQRYRLWTNSNTIIQQFGGTLSLQYHMNPRIQLLGNLTLAKLLQSQSKDGLEDGMNTPPLIWNLTCIFPKIFTHFNARFTIRHQSGFDYISFLVSGYVPAFFCWDFQWGYAINEKSWQFKLGAMNALNKPYYTLLGGPEITGFYYMNIGYNIKR